MTPTDHVHLCSVCRRRWWCDAGFCMPSFIGKRTVTDKVCAPCFARVHPPPAPSYLDPPSGEF